MLQHTACSQTFMSSHKKSQLNVGKTKHMNGQAPISHKKFHMIKLLVFLTWLPTSALAADAVARITDDAVRSEILKKQKDEIMKRGASNSTDCAELLAPLEGPTGPVEFAEATTAIEKTVSNIAHDYPAECINTLLQNLALITPTTPAIKRITERLDSYEPIVWGSNDKALACEIHESGIESLLDLATNAQSVNECAPLVNNQWKRVSGTSAHGNSLDYSLNKTAAGIRVALNINFQQDTTNSIPSENGVSNEKMMAQARGCMQAVGGLIKGAAGEPMQFDLLTPAEAARIPDAVRPKANDITIAHAPNVRSHSKNYAHDVGCPTIVHEILHLVGLCDEYPGEPDGYICRAVPKQNNVMVDTFQAFNASVPRRVTCECPNDDCAAAIAQPGRLNFLKAPRWGDRTSARFRNAFCTTPTGTPSLDWPFTYANPPKQPFSATLSPDGLKLSMTDYYMSQINWKTIYGSSTECTCPQTDTRCRETLAQIASGQMKVNNRGCHSGLKEDVVWGATTLGDVITGNKFSFDENPGSTPFIHPKQVERIMAGSCMTQVQSYNDCAKNAYASTPEDCADVEEHCLKSDFHEQP
jgi:hypothetical protein